MTQKAAVVDVEPASLFRDESSSGPCIGIQLQTRNASCNFEGHRPEWSLVC